MRRIAISIKSIEIVDKTFIKSPRHYIIQSLLATLAVVVILNFVSIFTQTVIVAVLGASTFIVFAMPGTVSAEPRRLVGGHIIGVISGLVCYYGLLSPALIAFYERLTVLHWLPAAVAVGLSIFLMTVFNAEHPPAAGTALGLVVNLWTYQTIIFIVVCAVILAVIRAVFRKYLKDLYT